jgi:hypothetical protein
MLFIPAICLSPVDVGAAEGAEPVIPLIAENAPPFNLKRDEDGAVAQTATS